MAIKTNKMKLATAFYQTIALASCLGVAPAAIAQQVRAQHGMVASASSIASQVGVDILKKGGNAVDSACAVGLALAVTYPVAGNLGGGGFMLIRQPDGNSIAIDYRETAPAAAARNMYLDAAGNVKPGLSLTGYRASGVPGTVAGLGMAHKKYGHLPWRDIVEPARKLAAQGIPVSYGMANGLRATKELAKFAESKRIFLKSGEYYRTGDTFRQPELAATLERIQKLGPAEFYTGATAKLIIEDMKKHRGLITLNDLASYHPVERTPVKGTYRGYDIISMPPPSSGGAALIQMLNILERHDLASMGYNSASANHLMIETMRRAFADRSEFPGDPDFVKVPVGGLTSKKYAEELDATIRTDHATPSTEIGHGAPGVYESPETTHFSVVDSAGCAVSNTYTLNMGYGSAVTIAGAGFLMNDEMDDFTSKPGSPNGFGLIQGEANAIVPGKRPLSSMTPTILCRNGKLFMVIGSPGGPTIINTVLQVILNVVDHGMDIGHAIAAPRFHHQWIPDVVAAETYAFPAEVMQALTARGHIIDQPAQAKVRHQGDAEGILIDPTTGDRVGASDPRSSDAAAKGY